MNDVLNRIDRVKSKVVLSKLINILMKEYSNGYYDNAANIHKRIYLIEPFENEEGYTHYEHITIYHNGMYEFDNINVKLIAIDEPYPKTYKRAKQKSR